MKNVLVLGHGVMGKGIAEVLLSFGYNVCLVGRQMPRVEAAFFDVSRKVQKRIESGKLPRELEQHLLESFSFATLESEQKPVEFVIEAVPENIESKKSAYEWILKNFSSAQLIATNTSSINVDLLADHVGELKEKFIGLHFFNPAPIMQLVEVIPCQHTSSDALDRAKGIVESVAKTSVMVKNSPGFIVNRLLLPYINDAIRLLEDGVATAKDIDSAMKLGANHPIGPLALADLIGLDVCHDILRVLAEETLNDRYTPATLLGRMVENNRLGRKSKLGFFEY